MDGVAKQSNKSEEDYKKKYRDLRARYDSQGTELELLRDSRVELLKVKGKP
jgi:hypothetical protein